MGFENMGNMVGGFMGGKEDLQNVLAEAVEKTLVEVMPDIIMDAIEASKESEKAIKDSNEFKDDADFNIKHAEKAISHTYGLVLDLMAEVEELKLKNEHLEASLDSMSEDIVKSESNFSDLESQIDEIELHLEDSSSMSSAFDVFNEFMDKAQKRNL